MKIAVDCRYLGKSGIGRVCQGIIDNLDYDSDEIYLVGEPKKLSGFKKAVIIPDYTRPYSAKGLLKFNKKRVNRECDALIIPNFLVPYGIKIPVHSVMHDLIFLDVKETVNGITDYTIKKSLLKRCMKKSKTIACVSAFTKSRCEYHFPRYSGKCYVNYNGLSREVLEYGAKHSAAGKNNTIVFVGNVKRHKGLTTLLEAFSKIGDDSVTLKIIGEKQGFITGLELDESAYKNVVFTGKLESDSLYYEIQNARYLVQPSVYEGFGLPPLEALYLGTQPIISDIEVFREIYGDLPVKFFKTKEELTELINTEPDEVMLDLDVYTKKYSYECFSKIILGKIDT